MPFVPLDNITVSQRSSPMNDSSDFQPVSVGPAHDDKAGTLIVCLNTGQIEGSLAKTSRRTVRTRIGQSSPVAALPRRRP